MGFVLFFILAGLMILSAIGVVVVQHPVRSAMCLVMTLFLLAVFFIFLDADFVAALQVVVYAGAIMVVFLFVIMLLNLQQDQPEAIPGRRGFAALVGASVFALILLLLLRRAGTLLPGPGMTTEVAAGFGTTESVGLRLFTEYLLQFEITGLLMLASVIGAVVLAKRKIG
jgi:NADH-quinone oxidoreductase subunit J